MVDEERRVIELPQRAERAAAAVAVAARDALQQTLDRLQMTHSLCTDTDTDMDRAAQEGWTLLTCTSGDLLLIIIYTFTLIESRMR